MALRAPSEQIGELPQRQACVARYGTAVSGDGERSVCGVSDRQSGLAVSTPSGLAKERSARVADASFHLVGVVVFVLLAALLGLRLRRVACPLALGLPCLAPLLESISLRLLVLGHHTTFRRCCRTTTLSRPDPAASAGALPAA